MEAGTKKRENTGIKMANKVKYKEVRLNCKVTY